MEALQGAELTSTNRPCGLTLFSKANIVASARSPGDDRSDAPSSKDREPARVPLPLPPQKGSRRISATSLVFGRPKTVSGGFIEEAIPDPISNSEVKLLRADGTARIAVWESRTLPG